MEKKTFQKGFYLSSSTISPSIILSWEITPSSSIEILPSSVNNLWSLVLKKSKIITYQYMQPLSRYIKTSPISIKSTQQIKYIMEKKTFQKGFYLSSSTIRPSIILSWEITPSSSSIEDDPCSPVLKKAIELHINICSLDITSVCGEITAMFNSILRKIQTFPVWLVPPSASQGSVSFYSTQSLPSGTVGQCSHPQKYQLNFDLVLKSPFFKKAISLEHLMMYTNVYHFSISPEQVFVLVLNI